jgi:signal transduction histidine kinase
MFEMSRTSVARYFGAFLSVTAALGLTLFARPFFVSTAYALFLAAVMFSSWFGGLTPGLIVVLISVLALDRYFASPDLSGVLSRDDFVHLGIFLVVSGSINYLSRTRIRAEKALRASHEELESRIEQRTADLRRLSGQLLHSQDEERRRIARLLHETVSQDLAALKLDLSAVKRHYKGKVIANRPDILDEALSLTDECIREVRTVSYLLHPPLLDEAGLASALEWYSSGFERRSGITTKLDLPRMLERLPRETEMTVFRLVQECLTNVHRHSGSPSVHISVRETPGDLIVEIRDCGHGISDPKGIGSDVSKAQVGVGIMGMHERVKQAGGKMRIQSNDHGTTVTAILPIARSAVS